MAVLQQQVPAGTWTLDPVHSTAAFSVKHMAVATFRGQFTTIEATLDNGGDEPQLTGIVPVASVDVRDADLSSHLLSPDFFDAERHPEIRFESVAIRPGADGQLDVEGDLTLKGVTKRVAAKGTVVGPIADPYGGERIGIDLTTQVDRNEFGLSWNAPMPNGDKLLGDVVTLAVHLELSRSEA